MRGQKWYLNSLPQRDQYIERMSCCDTSIKRYTWGFAVFAILLTVIVLLSVSIKKVDSTEYGVLYDVHTKQLNDAIRTGGLHVGPPGFEFIRFPSTFITDDLTDTCLSRDGLRVNFAATFQYQMPEVWLVPAILRYRDFLNWATVVKAAADSAGQHACSEFNITDFQNQRGVIQQAMEDNLRLKLEGNDGTGTTGVYAKAISLQLSNVDIPKEYSDAVAQKQAADEDISLAINQRSQEVTKARTGFLTAQKQAQKISDTAMNDANVTMTEAKLTAEATLYAFEIEAETLVEVGTSLNLTVEGVLGFLSNQMLAGVSNLSVLVEEPARFSYKDQL